MDTSFGLKNFWETRSSNRARHHCDGLSDWTKFVDTALFSYLDDDQIQTVIEWGCGRGEMSVKLAERGFDVHLVDLLDASLAMAELRLMCNDHLAASRTQVEHPEEIVLPVEQIDALVCVAVVQHFPTVAYWRKIASVWRNLQPKKIILQTRNAPTRNQQPEDYCKDYLHSLWLTTDEVLSQFPNYTPIFQHLDTPEDFIWSGTISYEYFVLERNSE